MHITQSVGNIFIIERVFTDYLINKLNKINVLTMILKTWHVYGSFVPPKKGWTKKNFPKFEFCAHTRFLKFTVEIENFFVYNWLPLVTRTDEIKSCIKSSRLWTQINKLYHKTNIRVIINLCNVSNYQIYIMFVIPMDS